MPPHLDRPNLNHLWAALLVEELVRQGTTFFVVCPGSRSTPLAVAASLNPRAEVLVHWDERAAAFVALGWGKATGRPAAVVTTSGTAVANLLPAAVEARQAGMPLLLLTADRPPELRETGANQAIRQPGLFATVARWETDLGTPSADVDPAFVLTTVAEAVARALDGGPVHLNGPFREPLAPTPDGVDTSALLARLGEILPEAPPRSLLHGDLWAGNALPTAAPQTECRFALIDPAVSVGHREADLAMTELFGGFAEPFYDGYREAWPLEPGYEERREIYNLFHLINHLTHGPGYRAPVERTLRRFA